MALTKVNRGGLNTGISDSSNATFLTVDSSEQAVIKSEGGSNTTSVQQGLLKAWGNFDGSGTVGTNDSFNMDSLTDNGTGNYTVSITNDLANAHGCMSGYSIMDGLVYGDSSNVSSAGTFQMRVVVGSSNSLMDPDEFHVQIAGDLS